MNLLSIFDAIEHTGLAQAIQNSMYVFPITEVFHLLGLAVLSGAVLLVDMRMLGLGLTAHAPAQLADYMRPYQRAGLLTMILSGLVLFISEATKCYYHTAFWVKMAALALAITVTYTYRGRAIRGSGSQKLAAILSVMLWATVGIAGRWIGFE